MCNNYDDVRKGGVCACKKKWEFNSYVRYFVVAVIIYVVVAVVTQERV